MTPKRSRQSARTQRQPQADAKKIDSAHYPEHESHILASTQPGEQLQLYDDDPASPRAASLDSSRTAVSPYSAPTAALSDSAPTAVDKSAKIIEYYLEEPVKMFNDVA